MTLPRPKIGEDARGFAARALVAGATANRRLSDDAAFWRDVELRVGAPDQ